MDNNNNNDNQHAAGISSSNSNYSFGAESTVEVNRFFGKPCNKENQEIITFKSDITFLIGPPKSCKSSLLFQYGYSYTKQGYSVLYICEKKRFNSSLPMMSNSEKISNNQVNLKHLKIKQNPMLKCKAIVTDIESNFYIVQRWANLALQISHSPEITLPSTTTTTNTNTSDILYNNNNNNDSSSFQQPTPISTTNTTQQQQQQQQQNTDQDRKLYLLLRKYDQTHNFINIQFTVQPSISTFKFDCIQFNQKNNNGNNDNDNDK
ncbi:hypothetical protein PPL_05488 [Heterostelium album PN500]|uniref:Uncharacterized protein n=1 Tax=Heterostelium pallidum (strain ATCC 26659 / Pp 5 / PN500) TaxID=670386 RepID=D3BAB2_HETP5|nr:hypothetical protein PPL_05488 [Heterostelium album PN500]EFA81499.1 hypothetical protein PPL_05488 [Heterostelium album PN500]|eukprot:XP_020433616.1 hypothetical protein PPL_05488 [Heterostelium album PN500]